MKKVLLVALVLSLSFAVGLAQDKIAYERSQVDVIQNQSLVCPHPNAGQPGSRATLTLLETLPVGALTGCLLSAGIDFDGTDWWMTGDVDGYYGLYSLYQINRAATAYTEYVNTWSTWYPPIDIADAPSTGIVDAAPYDWEGYYNDMYRHVNGIGDNLNPVAICDFASPTGQCYDALTNTYWVMEAWNIAFHQVDAAGTISTIADGSPGTMGMELDQRLPGYEYIWTFQQSPLPEFWVFDLQLGSYLPEVYAASGVDMAGGACIANVTGYADPVLVGLHQASPDYVNVYELPTLGMAGAMVDIKANGGDAGVVVFQGNNLTLTIDVTAAGDAGLNSDIFVLVKNAAKKKWAFNLANDRWFKGWCYEYVTGPLTDYTDTVLDMPLPIGLYDAYLAIDTVPNGNLDKGSLLVYDSVDFEVKAPSPGFAEDFEDGVSDLTPDDPAWYVAANTFCNGVYSYYFDGDLDPGYNYYASLYGGGIYADFTLSCDTAHISTTTPSDIYYHGLCFRSQGTAADCYVYYCDADGKLGFRARVGSSGSDLWYTYSPAGFNLGRDVKNNIEVVAIGSSFTFYTNGVMIGSISDSTWTQGLAGTFAEGSAGNNNLFEYDDVTLN